MISKALTKRILALHTKKGREKEGIFLAEGRKVLLELAAVAQKPNSPWQVLLYILPEQDAAAPQLPWVQTILEQAEAPCHTADAETIAQLSTLQNNQEGLALVYAPAWPAFAPASGKLYLALDGIRDPGNLGTLMRLADWFGIGDVLASPDTCEWQNPKAVSASMGSFLRTRVHYGDLAQLMAQIPLCYGALLDGVPSYEVQHTGGTAALVIGSESHGIRPEVLPLITHPITIPGSGSAESLNAAMAAGILLYQLRKP
jgi:TrmH family RNA methyltransferase